VNEGSIRSLLDSRGVVDFAKMIAWNPETRLRNVFAKALHKGHVRNAELSPPAPEHIASLLSLGEKCIVVVRDKKQRLLWVTDRRLLMEDGPAVSELFAFSAVERVHWMARENRFQLSKSDNFDRLEIDWSRRGKGSSASMVFSILGGGASSPTVSVATGVGGGGVGGVVVLF
jgi:hypothetical protein